MLPVTWPELKIVGRARDLEGRRHGVSQAFVAHQHG